MTEDQKKLEVATFRFGIIADFVKRLGLERGEIKKLLEEKAAQRYKIPHSSKTEITKGAIVKWLRDYKSAGEQLTGLYPKTRSDKGDCKSLEAQIKIGILEVLKDAPKATVPAIIKTLRHKKIIASNETINHSTIYRFLTEHRKTKLANIKADDRRRFEAEYPNQIWQSDVMHGPHIKITGDKERKHKTYLIAFLDDYSRFIVHAEFYFAESLASFKSALQSALLKRGLPHTLYVDNGACYKADGLIQIGAILGISIKHSRPYIPQGRGKIERWFKTVRDGFFTPYFSDDIFLDQLNESFHQWVEEYNKKVHSSTNETPFNRYMAGLECIRPAPDKLGDYFRAVTSRQVKKDRTFQLNGVIYEAPVGLIDRRVELRYDPESMRPDLEIFYNGASFGMATVLDPQVNSQLGRNWMELLPEVPSTAIPNNPIIKSGELPLEENHDEL